MKNLLKKVFGITEMEEALAETKRAMEEAEAKVEAAKKSAEDALKEEAIAKMTPKERATIKGEPWVTVLDTKVNVENPRNGFFELDWNEHFIALLRSNGFRGETEEEIVDLWFKELCKNVLAEEGLDTRRDSGYINVSNITDRKL